MSTTSRRLRSPTVLALAALLAGLILGAAAAATDAPVLRGAVRLIEPLGAIWVAAIRMTLVPLVVSLLVTSVASVSDVRAVGRLGARAIGWFLGLLKDKDVYAEMLVLNASTPDEAVADMAATCSAKLVEIVGQNQLRLLRHEDIIRKLCSNPNASQALIDSVCDFAVRSGLMLADVPQMQAARVRLFGPQAAEAPPDPGPTAEQVLQDFKEDVQDENAAPMEEGKKQNLTQRIMKMSIAEKIKLATLGNKEARTLLLRDSNKLVCTAVIRSPRITDGEVLACAMNRAANEEVLRIIYGNREWTKNQKIKLALVKNPKIPLTVVMKFLNSLRDAELKDLARDRNVPSGVSQFAKKLMEKKTTPKKEEK